ncbi:bile acid:sodium symporter family protein [Granulicoccus sp. GXG6511]|uniref:bile acid:sodium symporter family protein n=1 Tax=Granulicoccus sp. GXG6511 TaxID=3381351 RepID=UPI003D7E03CA
MKRAWGTVKEWVDVYILLLFGMVLLAAVMPATGVAVRPVEIATDLAVALLFFLYGARLSADQTLQGIRHWRLHSLVLACTYVMFPLLGLLTAFLSRPFLGPELAAGMLFLTLLPSTVQSSVAFTSIAHGNVAASIVAASVSNLLGVLLTPLLVTLAMGAAAGVNLGTIRSLFLQLVLPFVLGQLVHRWLGGFLARHKQVTSKVDRGAILLVVYAAFSAGMREDMFSRLGGWQLVALLVVCCVLLAVVLAATMAISKALGFAWPDRTAIIFAGSKKSMASGLPMAQVIFPAAAVGILVLPLMLFHQIQLIVCAQLARRWSRLTPEAGPTSSTAG